MSRSPKLFIILCFIKDAVWHQIILFQELPHSFLSYYTKGREILSPEIPLLASYSQHGKGVLVQTREKWCCPSACRPSVYYLWQVKARLEKLLLYHREINNLSNIITTEIALEGHTAKQHITRGNNERFRYKSYENVTEWLATEVS